ncbi:MAG: hypothetical protein C4562_01580 [Actinobacteria bacterium]|nr:MAG: hypothetical protein C4562_01580 [Actinomycetota bacterium]
MRLRSFIFVTAASAVATVLITRPDIRKQAQKAIERLKISLQSAYEEGRVEAIKKEEELHHLEEK